MVGAGALILGGLGFGVFWCAGLLGLETPWEIGLFFHGAWMAALAVGVVQRVRPLRGRLAAIGWAGAVATLLGMVTAFPLFGAGLIGLAIAQWPDAARRPAAAALVMGAVFLLASLPLEGRIEGNGTPQPGTAAAALFTPAVLFVSIGFVLLGARSLRAQRPHATVAPSG